MNMLWEHVCELGENVNVKWLSQWSKISGSMPYIPKDSDCSVFVMV